MDESQLLRRKAMLMVLLIFSSLSRSTDGACPPGWDSVGPGCYQFIPIPSFEDLKTYSESSSACSSIGGRLIVFNDDNEREMVGNSVYVTDSMRDQIGFAYTFWVGCTDQSIEGTFECEDGTQLALDSDLWRISNGDPHSAIPGGQGITDDCVVYLRDSQGVEDVACNTANFALCEVEPSAVTTTSPPFQQANDRERSGFYSMAKDINGSPLIDRCLTDHVMKTIPIKSKLHCAAECGQEPRCKSFNYKNGLCELNNETKNNVGLNYFAPSDGCLYYEPI